MKRMECAPFGAVVQRVRAAGQILGFCAALVLAACGGGGGGSDVGSITPAIVAPSIGTHPQDAKVIDGATATFSVSASGSSLTYQWQREGQAIAGANGASYTTPVLHMTDNGAHYQVVVSGPNVSVTSNTVTLTVTPIPINVTTQPQAQTAKDGEAASFDVAVTGSEPLTYQWQRDGVAIADANKAGYTTSALALSDTGAVFNVVITNPAGTVTSQEAKLTVTTVAPRIVTAPESVTTTDGSTVTFQVKAAGSAPLAYQWLLNGSPISGATGASYTTTLAYASSGDRYTVQVTNIAGQVISTEAVATVNANAVSITRHPIGASIATGGSANFTVVASGTAPISYQWQQSQNDGLTWTAIAGATSASYAISNVTLADAATRLRVTMTNPASTLSSNAAMLTVQPNVRIIAGTAGGLGYADGQGGSARFDWVGGLSVDTRGNIYVADQNNRVIRRVTPEGVVTRVAGKLRSSVRMDGGVDEATFLQPSDVLVDRAGIVYVSDSCTIRRIAGNLVTTLVGDGNCVTRDGTGTQAGVGQIKGMVLDGDGNVIFTESNNANGQLLRRMTPAGVVSTIAGSATEGGKVDGNGGAARFYSIGKLVLDASKTLYVLDGSAVRSVSPAGEVSTYAGVPDVVGATEGYRTSARFGYLRGLAFDAAGNLFLADSSGLTRISTAGYAVKAIGAIPSGDGHPASIDGSVTVASAGTPGPMVQLPDGRIAFFDLTAYSLRILSSSSALSTLAGGGRAGGFADGVGAAVRFAVGFFRNNALIIGPAGDAILADHGSHRIRRLLLDTAMVSTLAGTSESGATDGPLSTATFDDPLGLAYDKAGNLYVTDTGTIRRISSAGAVSLVAGKAGVYGSDDGVGTAARFGVLAGVVIDSKGNLIVADAGNCLLRQVTPDGVVSTLAGKAGKCTTFVNGVGGAARLGQVKYLVIDAADNVFFTDTFNAVRKLASNGEVTTVAGAPYANGFVDDVSAFARFSNPAGLAFDVRGNLYVADTYNNAIRRITPGGYVGTVIGGLVGVLQPGLNGSINYPMALAVTPAGRLIFVSEGAIVGD